MMIALDVWNRIESLLSSETVVAAVLGSGFTLVVRWYLEYRKERRTRQQTIVGELSFVVHESIAALMELHAAHANPSDSAHVRKCLANVTRLEGKVMQFEVQVWRAFKEREVRANYHRLINRIERTKALIMQEEIPSEKVIEVAFAWIRHQFSKTAELAGEASGISLRDPARIVFLGLNPFKWREKIENLSFEDEPPPWVFDVQIEFSNRQLSSDAVKATIENLRCKVGEMRCQTHGYAPHVRLHGRGPENFDIQIGSCCKEFIEAVYAKALKTSNVGCVKRTEIINDSA